MTTNRETWHAARFDFSHQLLGAEPTYVGEWQSQTAVDGANTTYEILNASFSMQMPETKGEAARVVGPNLPWAEDHFQERVSGEPLNPPPSNAWWPFAVAGNDLHKAEEKFSHTYPERYWPKFANIEGTTDKGRQIFVPHVGTRFEYGDLGDLVHMLVKSPYTRQAYLPVWFPEDTGSASGQRVPCTLGYQFLIRETPAGKVLHIFYHMRSCDFIRHLPDDIYMTIRLAQWMRDEVVDKSGGAYHIAMGKLFFQAGSLHIFEPDRLILGQIHREMALSYDQHIMNALSGGSSS